ncbi:MAG: hypothetical protein ACI82A_003324, partial [Candidatus Azotimanducaceae bacterium]
RRSNPQNHDVYIELSGSRLVSISLPMEQVTS